MNNKLIKYVSKGGLLDRRSFLLSGLAYSTAYSLSALADPQNKQKPIGDSLPGWMKTPGRNDTEYGQPSSHEKHIKRYIEKSSPETATFSIWHTPIQNQRGISPQTAFILVRITTVFPKSIRSAISYLFTVWLKNRLNSISKVCCDTPCYRA